MEVELKIICPKEPFNGKYVTAKTTPEAIMTARNLHDISLLDELYMKLLNCTPQTTCTNEVKEAKVVVTPFRL